MRKKSHILLAGYLADQMAMVQDLQLHRKAFCLGSILPDCYPSFLTTRHEFLGTFETIKERMQLLVMNGTQACSERAFWRKIGEILHYIADYFTFPHNETFTGGFRDHNHYEKELKDRLKEYITSGEAHLNAANEPLLHFQDLSELIEYVQMKHASYLNSVRTVAEDIQDILTVCKQVMCGILQLCTVYVPSNMAVI